MMAWLQQTGRWVSILAVLAVGSLVGGCRTSEAVFSDLQDLPATPSTDDGRVFQVGDLVTIYYVATNAPQSHEERIKGDGTITLPFIGSIVVAGKTSCELQKELQERYPKYFVPYRTRDRYFWVGGEVRSPGRIAYLGETTVAKAIQAAGDFTEFANKKNVELIHPDGRTEIINLTKVSKDLGLNQPVYPGDRIVVPRRFGFGF